MRTVLLPPGDNPIAVNKYIISYIITPDDGQKKSPKHVGFFLQNKIWEIRASGWFYWKESRKMCQGVCNS